MAPAVEPVFLQDIKMQTSLDALDVDRDDLLRGLISAAVDLLDGDGELGRAMITQTWAQWVPQSPGVVRLAMGPFQSLTAIDYFDADGAIQSASTADFETRKAGDFVTVQPKSGAAWPRAATRLDAIRLTYVAGFGDAPSDVPQSIRHAIAMIVAHLFENREATTELSLSEVPMGAQVLLSRHRVGWYG